MRVIAYLGARPTAPYVPRWQVQYGCGHQVQAQLVTLRQFRRGGRRCHRCHYERQYLWEGVTQSMRAWARQLGLYYPTLSARLARGVPFARAIVRERLVRTWMRKPLRIKGELVSQAEAARRLGISREAVRQRLRHGWAPRRAYTQPRQVKSLDPGAVSADNAGR